MGDAAEQKLARHGLTSARGFLQSRVAARLQTRYTPVLSFKLDDSVKKSVEMSRLIDETLAADRRDRGETRAEGSGAGSETGLDTPDPSSDRPDRDDDEALDESE